MGAEPPSPLALADATGLSHSSLSPTTRNQPSENTRTDKQNTHSIPTDTSNTHIPTEANQSKLLLASPKRKHLASPKSTQSQVTLNLDQVEHFETNYEQDVPLNPLTEATWQHELERRLEERAVAISQRSSRRPSRCASRASSRGGDRIDSPHKRISSSHGARPISLNASRQSSRRASREPSRIASRQGTESKLSIGSGKSSRSTSPGSESRRNAPISSAIAALFGQSSRVAPDKAKIRPLSIEEVVEAAKVDDVNTIHDWMDDDNDVDMMVDGDCTLLHVACECNSAAVVEILLEHGAREDVTDSDHQTPLHFATASGNLEVVKVLTAGPCAQLLALDRFQMTPFHLACESGNADLVEYLITRFDTRIDGKMRRGSALFIAQRNEHSSVVEILERYAAFFGEVEAVEEGKDTPKGAKGVSFHTASAPMDDATASTRVVSNDGPVKQPSGGTPARACCTIC